MGGNDGINFAFSLASTPADRRYMLFHWHRRTHFRLPLSRLG